MKERMIVALLIILSLVFVSTAFVVGQEWKQDRIERGE